jgi:hypothetical protein
VVDYGGDGLNVLAKRKGRMDRKLKRQGGRSGLAEARVRGPGGVRWPAGRQHGEGRTAAGGGG